jgi:formate dehydrogenase
MAPQLDVLTLKCPLYPETEQMLNARTLALLKRGAYVINTARGVWASGLSGWYRPD